MNWNNEKYGNLVLKMSYYFYMGLVNDNKLLVHLQSQFYDQCQVY